MINGMFLGSVVTMVIVFLAQAASNYRQSEKDKLDQRFDSLTSYTRERLNTLHRELDTLRNDIMSKNVEGEKK